MSQVGAVFKIGATYLRITETGWVYPIHEELEKLVRKERAEYVQCESVDEDGEYTFKVVKAPEAEEPRKISTPARRPVVVPTAPEGSTVIITAPPVQLLPETPQVPIVAKPTINLAVD